MGQVKPNVATFVRRESSKLTPEALPQAALDFVNQLSTLDRDVNYVTLRFDTVTKAVGLTYSDALKQELGLAENHYDFNTAAPSGSVIIPAPHDNTSSQPNNAQPVPSFRILSSPFSQGTNPPALSAAQAIQGYQTIQQRFPDKAVLALLIRATDWESFYAKLIHNACIPDIAELIPFTLSRLQHQVPDTHPALNDDDLKIEVIQNEQLAQYQHDHASVLCALLIYVFDQPIEVESLLC